MPKNYAYTKRGKVEVWLKHHQHQGFRTKTLAQEFKTTSSNITELLRDLALNGWSVEKYMGGRNTYYIVSKNETK